MHLSKYVFFLQLHVGISSPKAPALRLWPVECTSLCRHSCGRDGMPSWIQQAWWGRISLIAVSRMTMSWIPLDTQFCIYLNLWEFQKPHETVWDDLNWDFHRIPRQGDAWASTIRRQVTFWASAVSLWCWSPMQRRLLENMTLFVDLFGLCVLFFLCRYFFGL